MECRHHALAGSAYLPTITHARTNNSRPTALAVRALSGRELAAAAGVNYGQNHHYFGNVHAVFQAALKARWEAR